MKRKFLLTCAAIAAMFVGTLNASAQYTEGVTVAEGTDYFLYNIEGQKFLTDGMDWGTHATIDNAGRVITIASTGDGTYSIYAKNFSNSEKAGYMTTNGYIDSGTNDANWVFTPVTLDGYTNVYTITNTKDDVTSNLWYNTTDARVAVDASAPTTDNSKYWLLIPKSVRDAAGDVTYVLQNTDFNRPWERPIWVSTGTGGLDSNRNKEYYNTTFDVSQTVSSMALGKYKLTCQGFYRNGTTDDKNASLYINTTTSALKNIHEDAQSTIVYDNGSDWGTDAHIDGTGYFPDCQVGASMYFNKGLYNNEVTALVTDGTVKAGVSKSASVTNDWTVIDNFKLYYLGQTLNTGASTATTTTTTATDDTWYSLNITAAGEYRITSDVDATLTYETDGTLLPSEVTGTNLALIAGTPVTQTLEAGTIYFKTSAAGTVKILPNKLEDGQDITDLFVSNPSFEDATDVSTTITGWSQPENKVVMQTQNSDAFDKKQGTWFAEEWHKSKVTFDLSQTLASMPAGYYVVSAYASQNGGNFETIPTVYAGSNKVTVLNYSDKYSVAAQLTETADLKIGFSGKGDGSTDWSMVDDFHVVYYTTLPDVTAESGPMEASVKAALEEAIDAYKVGKTAENYNAFQNANMAAKVSEQLYASIAEVNAKAAKLDEAGVASYASTLTAYNNGTIKTLADAEAAYATAVVAQTTLGTKMTEALSSTWTLQNALASGEYGPNRWNTWSGTDNGMTSSGYNEYWIANENGPLQDNKIYKTVTGLHKGYYVANIEVAANDEKNSAACTGVTFTAGGVSNDLSTCYALSKFNGHAGQYGVLFQVTEDNTDVELALNTSSTTCNWLTFRNESLTYLGTTAGDLTSGDYTVKAQDNTYVNRGGDSSQEAILAASGLVVTASTTEGVTKFTFADGTDGENYLFGSTSSIYTNGTDKEKKGSTTYAVTKVADGQYNVFNIQKGKYFAAGTGAESGVAAMVYADTPYVWTIEAPVYAIAADYRGLQEAIETAEEKKLGFATGEYAPYNNVAAVQALAAAKAIDTEAQNLQETVQEAAAVLNEKEWTANKEEVNAVYDGSFNLTTATSGDYIIPTGWTNLGYNTRVYNSSNEGTNVGIKACSKEACMFAKFTTEYGTVDGYTMPLKAGNYTLKFIYGGWNEVGTRDIKVYNADNNATVTPVTVTAKNNTAHTNAESWSTYEGMITIPADGDYILSFYRANTSSQNQIAISDIELYTAPELTANMTITDAGYATFAAPFAVEIPEGINAYKVTGVESNGSTLIMEDVATTIPANTPVVLEGSAINQDCKGYSASSVTTCTSGLLTGVYAETTAPAGSYVLQKNDGKVAFYVVGSEESDAKPTVKVNRAYLTTSSSTTAKALNFTGEDATAINAINALTSGNAKIYDVNGRQLKQLKKGINIVNGAKVLVK